MFIDNGEITLININQVSHILQVTCIQMCIRDRNMADNFLERHREEYEIRKAAWLKKKKLLDVYKRQGAAGHR